LLLSPGLHGESAGPLHPGGRQLDPGARAAHRQGPRRARGLGGAPLMRAQARQKGFTLLEVMIALAILGMSLMAIFQLNSQAVAMHAYTKRLTVASMLARAK